MIGRILYAYYKIRCIVFAVLHNRWHYVDCCVCYVDMMFPYPVRSLSWHPSQHLLAVSMVGQGAAVILYAGDRERYSAFDKTQSKFIY